MSSTFQAHLEILPEAQWQLWPELRPTLQLGLVLYGGTAIRAMYGHNFQPSESLKALVYFAGGDLDSVARPERETLIKAVNAVRKLPTVKILARNLSPPMGHFPDKNLAGE